MYVEPFTVGVWLCCLAVGMTLAVAQWLTSKNVEEKEGAFIGVLATWLQQDASAVPGGLSGRWNFTVLSVCSMLVHAYYTSAIVSSLMSSGRGGPRNLRQLADSRYAIASDNHDFYRSKMFDVKTTWPDLEYLKRKKMDPSKFYQNFEYGIQLIQQGATAYHGEYHSLYPYLNTFSDVEICKMQQIDTVPEIMTWILASPKGQYTNLFRSASAWLKETGLAKRLLNRIRIQPPPCMAAMLAERVTFWDVSPLLAVTALAAVMSFILLGLEIVVANWRGNPFLTKSSNPNLPSPPTSYSTSASTPDYTGNTASSFESNYNYPPPPYTAPYSTFGPQFTYSYPPSQGSPTTVSISPPTPSNPTVTITSTSVQNPPYPPPEFSYYPPEGGQLTDNYYPSSKSSWSQYYEQYPYPYPPQASYPPPPQCSSYPNPSSHPPPPPPPTQQPSPTPFYPPNNPQQYQQSPSYPPQNPSQQQYAQSYSPPGPTYASNPPMSYSSPPSYTPSTTSSCPSQCPCNSSPKPDYPFPPCPHSSYPPQPPPVCPTSPVYSPEYYKSQPYQTPNNMIPSYPPVPFSELSYYT
ncbi:unnamed protein product [Diatraea saccharalis]|uniref:Ionotropic glutamate receptor C-terminal domain-containing protein n=1 Tax=Diatraea saccharalis TaxID=40085 RepID=A0A9N9WG54_9NEOP|nr:unnamed protein product [Diatraea saccharalis]